MTDQHSMGTVLRDPTRLLFVRRFRHAPEKVWRALTESEHLRAWMPCDIVGERAEGAAIELPFWPDVVEKYKIDEPVLSGTIRVWDPPRVFEWMWDTDILRWELESDGAGTTLTFTTWLGTANTESLANNGAGYHMCLDHLEQLLDTGSAPSVAEADPSVLEKRYAELVGIS